jgi:hypothetical protein
MKETDMSQLLFVTANLFILIICLVGAQSCYFRRRWKWFWLMLTCVVLSGSCVIFMVNQLCSPPPKIELPFVVRTPTTPL